MVNVKRLKEIFPEPPMVAYQQHSNLKSMMARAELPDGIIKKQCFFNDKIGKTNSSKLTVILHNQEKVVTNTIKHLPYLLFNSTI